MLGQGGAIAKRPPHVAAGGYQTQVETSTVTAVSNTAVPVTSLAAGIPMGGCWYCFTCSSDCYIIFGRSDVPAATSSNAYPMKAGIEYNWWVNDTDDAYFSVIRASADGVLTRYRSNN